MQNDKNFETKQKLSSTLIAMMNVKPISKITITSLVTKCKLNRKTFYYHFIDIYDLLEYTLKQEILNKLEEMDLVKDIDEAIELIMDYVVTNKRMIINVINDVKIDTIKLFFKNNFNQILRKYVEEIIDINNYDISDEFIKYSTTTLSSVIASAVYTWLLNNEEYDKYQVLTNTTFIFKNALNAVLAKANNVK